MVPHGQNPVEPSASQASIPPEKNYLAMLAIDIGKGTQDILVEQGEPTENSTKLVLPSPTVLKAREIRSTPGDIFVTGRTMGGGPVSKALIERAQTHDVAITPNASRTIRDDPREVADRGLRITTQNPGYPEIELTDVDLPRLRRGLETLGIETPDDVAVAVQDHGVAPPGVSDREFRIDHFREKLGNDGAPFHDFVHSEMTPDFTRVSAALDAISEADARGFVMDSKLASIAGALPDELPALVIDVGNGHTLAALVDEERRVAALLEHHTRNLTAEKLDTYLEKLIAGNLTHEEVFEDHGHGACTAHAPDPAAYVKTGPRRSLLDGSQFPLRDAHPLGDVMMAGPRGLFSVR